MLVEIPEGFSLWKGEFKSSNITAYGELYVIFRDNMSYKDEYETTAYLKYTGLVNNGLVVKININVIKALYNAENVPDIEGTCNKQISHFNINTHRELYIKGEYNSVHPRDVGKFFLNLSIDKNLSII